MAVSAHPALRLRPARRPANQYLLALALVAAATLVRMAADRVLHDQVPYFLYVAPVVVATWFGGLRGGVTSVLAGMLAADYYFVAPRRTLTLRTEDAAAMATFAAVSLGLVWLVARWRRSERDVRDLQTQAAAIIQHLPIGVVVADAGGRLILGNPAHERIARRPFVPTMIAALRAEADYTLCRPDGRVAQPEETPLSRALAGETVADEELHMTWRDGSRTIVNTNAAPIRDGRGRIAGAVMGVVDITEQKRAAETSRQRAEELQAILDTVPAAVFIARDPDSRHMDGNRFTAEVLRMPLRSNVSMTAPESERPTTFRAMRDGQEIPGNDLPVQVAARGVEVRDSEFDLEYEDGTVRTLFGNANPLRDGAGRVRGAVGAFVDVTERKNAEEALRTANRVKDEFLATLSHELRTPLNAIVGWSDMLRRGTLETDHASRAMESVYRNAKTLAEMINDVLDVSRIISGKVRIEMQPMDPAAVLQNALESVRSAAEARNVMIVTELAAVPFPVSGDPTRLQQVFWNLLSNAVKFTPPGGRIRVSLRLSNGQIAVQVADTGIGISPDFLPHVFERFRQRDSSMTRTQGGLGLGLAIVRHLIELHGGTVTAESAGEGQGATFTVTLPAQRFEERRHGAHAVARHALAIEPIGEDAPTLRGIRVLVVDDEAEAREVTASVLRHYGATVELAASAAQALDRFDVFDPTVLLVDLGMPEVDGFTLIDRIRRSRGGRGKAVPAIAFTAYARDEDQRRALASGFQLHLAKPVDSHALVRAVATVQRERNETRAS